MAVGAWDLLHNHCGDVLNFIHLVVVVKSHETKWREGVETSHAPGFKTYRRQDEVGFIAVRNSTNRDFDAPCATPEYFLKCEKFVDSSLLLDCLCISCMVWNAQLDTP
jgi:hypothetical protein